MIDTANLDRLEKDVSSVKGDISALTRQISDVMNSLAGTARKEARKTYKQARASAEDAIGDLSERGSAMMDAAQDAAATIEETVEDAIVQRPIAAMGLAIGLGFLIGVTWRRWGTPCWARAKPESGAAGGAGGWPCSSLTFSTRRGAQMFQRMIDDFKE